MISHTHTHTHTHTRTHTHTHTHTHLLSDTYRNYTSICFEQITGIQWRKHDKRVSHSYMKTFHEVASLCFLTAKWLVCLSFLMTSVYLTATWKHFMRWHRSASLQQSGWFVFLFSWQACISQLHENISWGGIALLPYSKVAGLSFFSHDKRVSHSYMKTFHEVASLCFLTAKWLVCLSFLMTSVYLTATWKHFMRWHRSASLQQSGWFVFLFSWQACISQLHENISWGGIALLPYSKVAGLSFFSHDKRVSHSYMKTFHEVASLCFLTAKWLVCLSFLMTSVYLTATWKHFMRWHRSASLQQSGWFVFLFSWQACISQLHENISWGGIALLPYSKVAGLSFFSHDKRVSHSYMKTFHEVASLCFLTAKWLVCLSFLMTSVYLTATWKHFMRWHRSASLQQSGWFVFLFSWQACISQLHENISWGGIALLPYSKVAGLSFFSHDKRVSHSYMKTFHEVASLCFLTAKWLVCLSFLMTSVYLTATWKHFMRWHRSASLQQSGWFVFLFSWQACISQLHENISWGGIALLPYSKVAGLSFFSHDKRVSHSYMKTFHEVASLCFLTAKWLVCLSFLMTSVYLTATWKHFMRWHRSASLQQSGWFVFLFSWQACISQLHENISWGGIALLPYSKVAGLSFFSHDKRVSHSYMKTFHEVASLCFLTAKWLVCLSFLMTSVYLTATWKHFMRWHRSASLQQSGWFVFLFSWQACISQLHENISWGGIALLPYSKVAGLSFFSHDKRVSHSYMKTFHEVASLCFLTAKWLVCLSFLMTSVYLTATWKHFMRWHRSASLQQSGWFVFLFSWQACISQLHENISWGGIALLPYSKVAGLSFFSHDKRVSHSYMKTFHEVASLCFLTAKWLVCLSFLMTSVYLTATWKHFMRWHRSASLQQSGWFVFLFSWQACISQLHENISWGGIALLPYSKVAGLSFFSHDKRVSHSYMKTFHEVASLCFLTAKWLVCLSFLMTSVYLTATWKHFMRWHRSASLQQSGWFVFLFSWQACISQLHENISWGGIALLPYSKVAGLSFFSLFFHSVLVCVLIFVKCCDWIFTLANILDTSVIPMSFAFQLYFFSFPLFFFFFSPKYKPKHGEAGDILCFMYIRIQMDLWLHDFSLGP